MKVVRRSRSGIDYLAAVLRDKPNVVTRAVFWRVPHRSGDEEIHLRIGRYRANGDRETLAVTSPKSQLTLDDEETRTLFNFLSENYEPLRSGAKKYIQLDDHSTAGILRF
jgi:hypothetical protein